MRARTYTIYRLHTYTKPIPDSHYLRSFVLYCVFILKFGTYKEVKKKNICYLRTNEYCWKSCKIFGLVYLCAHSVQHLLHSALCTTIARCLVLNWRSGIDYKRRCEIIYAMVKQNGILTSILLWMIWMNSTFVFWHSKENKKRHRLQHRSVCERVCHMCWMIIPFENYILLTT